eukprot:jgi/Hompol1/5533/HPOL_002004-RA
MFLFGAQLIKTLHRIQPNVVRYEIEDINTAYDVEDGPLKSSAPTADELLTQRIIAFVESERYLKYPASSVETELLCIDRDEYRQVMQLKSPEIQQMNIKSLSRLAHFSTEDDPLIAKRFAQYSKFQTYHANEPIIIENEISLDMFWILSGTCRCAKTVSFVKRKGIKGDEQMLIQTRDVVARKDDKVVLRHMTLFDLQPGDFFPSMEDSQIALMLHVKQLDRSLDIKQVLMHARSKIASGFRSTYTITAATAVDVMVVNWAAYISLATSMMINEVLDDNRFKITEEDLKKAYDARAKWDAYRKQTTEEVVKGRRPSAMY